MSTENNNCDISLPNIDCCPNPIGNIKSMVFIKKTDVVTDDNGKILRFKRKYGKFTREIIKAPIE